MTFAFVGRSDNPYYDRDEDEFPHMNDLRPTSLFADRRRQIERFHEIDISRDDERYLTHVHRIEVLNHKWYFDAERDDSIVEMMRSDLSLFNIQLAINDSRFVLTRWSHLASQCKEEIGRNSYRMTDMQAVTYCIRRSGLLDSPDQFEPCFFVSPRPVHDSHDWKQDGF